MNKKSKKVLVIDDEASVLKPIEYMLRLHNYQPFTTTQWTDALNVLEKEEPDLVMMDLQMPTVDGPTMLKFIREQEYDVPVVIVSASITDDTLIDLAEYQVAAYVHKPVKIFHIQEVVERIIGIPKSPRNATPISSVDPDMGLDQKVGKIDDGDGNDRRYSKKSKLHQFMPKGKNRHTVLYMGLIVLACLFMSGFMEFARISILQFIWD